MPEAWYTWQSGALILNIRVQPRARRDEIAGRLGEQLKIRLTAPPVDAKANRRLIEFLAELCAVAPLQVTLLAGLSGRNKRVRIDAPKRLFEDIKRP